MGGAIFSILCKVLNAHINAEFCNSVKSIKYVCKYVNKGSDMSMFGIQEADKNDEIKCYQAARYLSSNEAVWRILEFLIHEHSPAVMHLQVHLENGQRIYFTEENARQGAITVNNTKLMAFFDLCREDDYATTLLYNEVPQYFTWEEKAKQWKRRKQGETVEGHPGILRSDVIGRVYTVHPNQFECFCLRMLLHHVR